MAAKKKNKVKYPDENYLKQVGLTTSSINALTGQIGRTAQKITEIKLHQSVIKMQNVINAKENLSKVDHERRNRISNLKDKHKDVLEKLELLDKRNKTYVNTKKLDYEILQEERRKKAKQTKTNSLMVSPDFDKLIKSAANIYLQNTKVNKRKIKEHSSNTLTRNIVKNDINDIFKLKDNKKFSFKKSEPKSNVPIRSANLLSGFDFTSESTKFFAKELGWIERDKPKRIFESPLASYNTKKLDSKEQRDKGEKINENQTLKEDLNKENENQTHQEMDLKTIDEMVKKYAKEVEKINKQKEKKEIEAINISKITKKILEQSPLAKLSRDNKKKSVTPKGIDISKIPSIVFDEKK
ncbi:hypothetical protein SGLAD_v1c03650 [Spiroplasma gladiatoris]|uniref:Uncharacterized protein n=1 Tax=Spiroplasma gladiatoris TaxID=2143 RepID=A0A4P7AGN1_9MOLU|nr:hypothetical protein [Spiroplasma gladiatoris]QBQ07564.1 hypothetical protein SGLAD_v1c03650 [Spiroplasma gladiatoris]